MYLLQWNFTQKEQDPGILLFFSTNHVAAGNNILKTPQEK